MGGVVAVGGAVVYLGRSDGGEQRLRRVRREKLLKDNHAVPPPQRKRRVRRRRHLRLARPRRWQRRDQRGDALARWRVRLPKRTCLRRGAALRHGPIVGGVRGGVCVVRRQLQHCAVKIDRAAPAQLGARPVLAPHVQPLGDGEVRADMLRAQLERLAVRAREERGVVAPLRLGAGAARRRGVRLGGSPSSLPEIARHCVPPDQRGTRLPHPYVRVDAPRIQRERSGVRVPRLAHPVEPAQHRAEVAVHAVVRRLTSGGLDLA